MKSADPFETLAGLQDQALENREEDLARIKARTLHGLRAHRSIFPRRYALIAAAALLLCGLAFMSYRQYIAWRTPVASAPTEPSRWLVATENSPETMRFADGSTIALRPSSSARVLQTAPHSVRVLLEQGTATVHVTHAADTRWNVEAGPYNVTVTGTQFSLSWNREKQVFSLNLEDGTVVVDGPMLKEGKSITAGQQVMAWVPQQRIEISVPDAILSSAQTADTMNPDKEPSPARETSRSRSAHKSSLQSASADIADASTTESSWQSLCRAGKFQEVLDQARARGLSSSIQEGSLEDVMALGEAARLTGNRMITQEAYETVRNRFPRTPQASTAAFHLGRSAFDQHRAYTVAVRWLDIYLQESPDGRFAREALGRLMEAQLKVGNRAAAKRSAQSYISKYPQGIHAQLASDILKEN